MSKLTPGRIALGALVILASCNSTPFWGASNKKEQAVNAGSPPTASFTARSTVSDAVLREYKYVPSQSSRTSREDLFRLIAATNNAYDKLGLEKPYPMTRIVNAGHRSLGSRHAMATATLLEDGREVVYFNRDFVESGRDLKAVALHEYSHFAAWREHGPNIPVHGREFWAVCTSVTFNKNCSAYGGRFG